MQNNPTVCALAHRQGYNLYAHWAEYQIQPFLTVGSNQVIATPVYVYISAILMHPLTYCALVREA